MNLKEIFDTAKAQPLLLDLLPDAENGGKICPHYDCDGGRGNHKTGATKFTAPNGHELLGCFKCKAAGRNGNFSNVDLAAYHLGIPVTGNPYSGSDALDIAKFLADHFCWQLDGYSSPIDKNEQSRVSPSFSRATDSEIRKAKIRQIVAADISRYRKSPVLVPKQFARGIEQSTFTKFGVTFDAAFVTVESRLDHYPCQPTRRIIFPCKNFYLARLADRIDDYPEFARKYIKPKYNAGSVEIFNDAAIDEAPTGSVIYAVEGIFDALSLLQIGAEGVVAINGAPQWKKLVDRIKTRATDGLKVVILFDDDNAGRQAAENTKQALRRAHVPAIARFLPRATNDTSDEKNDANWLLRAFGADALRESFFQALDKSDEDFATIAAQIEFGKFGGLKSSFDTQIPKTAQTPQNEAARALKIDFNNREDSVFQDESAYFSQNFDEDVQRRRKFANRKTGFANIDEHQIFAPGLYILGGLPSIGKTTFAWQLADNLSAVGEAIFYISYEMSIAQLRAKTISHRVYEIDHNSRLSSAQIAIGGWNRTVDSVVTNLKTSTRIFRTLQATSEHSADKLITLLDKICVTLEKPPVIFIDYLQRMPRPPKMDVREGVSANARVLKDFQLKTNSTVIALSSFNRDNYSAPVSFESFKETGEIEYSADVMWGLQLYCVNRATGKIFDDRQAFANAKKQQPREMQLRCVKNREGNVYDCFFHYFSAFDTFTPCEESNFKDAIVASPEPIQTNSAKNKFSNLG